jgi:hypothetical protein
VWQQTGEKPAELVGHELPGAIAHVWGWFIELNRSRGMGAFAPSPISYQDILAWSYLTRSEPTPFEVGCITALDAVWLSSAQKEK